ncbi:hypothetical protein LCGC14_1238350, partial [marine sediment metagenome]
ADLPSLPKSRNKPRDQRSNLFNKAAFLKANPNLTSKDYDRAIALKD